MRLAWPLALANLLQMLVYAVDVIFIARLGDAPLAASSLAVSIFGIVMWCFFGMTGMVAALISAQLGRRAHSVREIRRSTRMALWLSVVLGVIGMVICLGGEWFMVLTGQDPEIIALSASYMNVVIWAMIPLLLAGTLRSFVSAMGRPIMATFITALAIGVNALANYAFIFGNLGAPELGLPGAGFATIITGIVQALAYLVAIWSDKRLRRYHILGNFWRPEWFALKELVRTGSPVALTILAEGGLFSIAAFMMGRFGATQLAGHTIALQVAALAFQIPFGVGQAATIRVGYFYGAKNRDGMARAGWVAIVIGTGFMALTASIMVLAPRAVLSIYVDVDAARNTAMVAFALQYLIIAAMFQLVDGLQAVAAGSLRGLQDTRVPMWFAIFSFWVPGFGVALLLGFGTPLEGIGVWIGLATGLLFTAILMVWRWSRREKLGLT